MGAQVAVDGDDEPGRAHRVGEPREVSATTSGDVDSARAVREREARKDLVGKHWDMAARLAVGLECFKDHNPRGPRA